MVFLVIFIVRLFRVLFVSMLEFYQFPEKVSSFLLAAFGMCKKSGIAAACVLPACCVARPPGFGAVCALHIVWK
tara:strand:+ start:268 stop:489 length:222 start_codon:yes stop_codon:yes gene_type:complete